MTDLNLAATVSDGGGLRTFNTPTNANDGSTATSAILAAYFATASDHKTAILKTDLGSATLVGSMEVYYSVNTIPWTSVEYSSDGSSWTAATGFARTTTTFTSLAFDAHSARYWRIVWDYTAPAGYQPQRGVHTWAIYAGTPPDPPPPPDPGVVIDPDPPGAGDVFVDPIDLSDYVMSWRIQRGASAEITGGATIGTATVVLRNVDPSDPTNPSNPDNDRFNPENAAGPLYGSLVDGSPLWIGVNSDGALSGDDPRGLFGGYTKDWTPILVPGAPYAPTVELTGEDALSWYGRKRVQVEDEIGRSQHDLRNQMLEAGGELRYDLANEITTMPLSSYDGDLLGGLEAINKANGTRHFCKPQNDRSQWYRYTTRNRQWRLDGTVDGALNAGSDHVTGITAMTLSADTVVNQQKATFTPVTFTPSSRVVWEAEGLPWFVDHAHAKVLWVEFDDYVKDPVLVINYTGDAPTQVITGFGDTAKVTISVGFGQHTNVTSAKVTGQLARRGPDESYTADDTDSQEGTRGVRAGSDIGPEFVGVLASATGIAKHVVWRYGNPQLRPQIVVQNWIPDDPDADVGQFDIDLYDVITLTTSQGHITTRLFEVIGLTHEAVWAASATGHLHITTYVLQESREQSDPGWFIIGTSLIEGTDVLAY